MLDWRWGGVDGMGWSGPVAVWFSRILLWVQPTIMFSLWFLRYPLFFTLTGKKTGSFNLPILHEYVAQESWISDLFLESKREFIGQIQNGDNDAVAEAIWKAYHQVTKHWFFGTPVICITRSPGILHPNVSDLSTYAQPVPHNLCTTSARENLRQLELTLS